MLKYAILGFLTYGPKTGYEIKNIMDQSTGHFWQAKQSQIYTTLKKLEEEALVVSRMEPQQGRPDRRVYAVSPAGGQALHDWLEQPVTELDKAKSTLLLKLFFSAAVDKEHILTQLKLLKNLHRTQYDLYSSETKDLIATVAAQDGAHRRDALLWEATRRFGELFEAAWLTWIDETITLIEKRL